MKRLRDECDDSATVARILALTNTEEKRQLKREIDAERRALAHLCDQGALSSTAYTDSVVRIALLQVQLPSPMLLFMPRFRRMVDRYVALRDALVTGCDLCLDIVIYVFQLYFLLLLDDCDTIDASHVHAMLAYCRSETKNCPLAKKKCIDWMNDTPISR